VFSVGIPGSCMMEKPRICHGAEVRDVWNHARYGQPSADLPCAHRWPWSATTNKVKAAGQVPTEPSQNYEAEAATLNGIASISACAACSGGAKVGFLALAAHNPRTFNNVVVPRTGIYEMQIDYLHSDHGRRSSA
jgi:alpha-galactosidase